VLSACMTPTAAEEQGNEMLGERLSMRKIREVLRLRLGQGLPQRAVAQSLRLSQGAVHGYMARARRAAAGEAAASSRR
jgi:DNA-directed RNA polymerase specialized sigma24 family protein